MFSDLSTRRIFLQKGLTILSVGVTIPTFLDHTVMAMAAPNDLHRTQKPNGKDGKILVVVQLSGGNDGLNTVVPYGDDAYHRARPNLGVGNNEVLKLTDYLGLHPNLKSLKGLYDDGKLAIVQGVGYPNPNRSHFRSMDIWQSAEPDNGVPSNGWLGRYFDNTCTGVDPHIGVSMGEVLPLAMRGDRITPLSFERPDQYRYNGSDRKNFSELNNIDEAPPTTKPSIVRPQKKIVQPASAQEQVDFLSRTAMDAQVSSDKILRITQNHNPPVAYPGNEFGQGLRTVAAMIQGGLSTRVYYVSLGGFDTHAGERGRHDQLMKQFSDGVNAFWTDLKSQENDDRVLMMTFSEFGRRVEQNASGGTDHGAAAPMFLIGQKVNSGLIGDHPSMTNLDQGDLKYNVDFRNVYATVLQNWLEAPSKPILGEQFRTINAFKA
jgi:uncharacterized protein (DUF1501 family)